MRRKLLISAGIATAAFITSAAQEQVKPADPLTLKATVGYALSHYPAVRAALEKKNAATADVGLSRTAYLPSANVLWQGNRTTRNNIFGLPLPQSVMRSISGQVLSTANNDSVWGSAAGALVGWEPFDFGYRRAGVDAARANEHTARQDRGYAPLSFNQFKPNEVLQHLRSKDRSTSARIRSS